MKRMKKWAAILLTASLLCSILGCSEKKEINTGETKQTQTEQENVSQEITVNLHYLRSDGNYDGWNVWFWTDGDGSSYKFDEAAKDDKGVVTTITLPPETMKLGFIVRMNEWEAKDTEGDRFVELAEVLSGTVDVYVTSGEEKFEVVMGDDVETGISIYDVQVKDDYQTVEFKVSGELSQEETDNIKILDGDLKEMETTKISVSKKKGIAKIKDFFKKRGNYYVSLEEGTPVKAGMPNIYSTEDFEKEYAYDGNDLGAVWTKDATNFKVWAPTADAVSVNLYKEGDAEKDDKIESLEMKKGDKGVWSAEKTGDLNGVYYTYSIKVDGQENEACDPYAKTTGVNGNRAMVIDMAATNPKGWENDKRPNSDLKITDAFIYELQVRDLSADKSAGIKNVGKYLALTETGTKTPSGVATGLDHMKDLGITHLHLNPVYDYATVDETKLDSDQYNWGYDPKNYNVPEGSYSTDPYHGEVRVEEFKQMVQTLHENGISVVLDVVYNHTYSGEDFCYNKIVPGYFHRINEKGVWSNGSGCGNDVASERAMVSKYIVDSVTYWAEEYHVDGFRFDLVGLTDVDTINAIRTSLDKIDPSIIMYGEGWDLATDVTKDVKLAIQENAVDMPGMALFSDNIRDSVKGSVFEAEEGGYVNGKVEDYGMVMKSVRGKPGWSKDATQVINYVCCHDNLTLWDKINSTSADDTLEDRIKQNLLAASIVHTSQGVPFILAGEEMLRSKVKEDGTFDENSYASPDSVNSIKWDTLDDENTKMVYEFYKGLIAFRKAHESLRMENVTLDQIKFYEQPEHKEAIVYEVAPEAVGASGNVFVVYNPFREDINVTLPEGNWDVYIKGQKAGNEVLETVSGEVNVESVSCMVLVKK